MNTAAFGYESAEIKMIVTRGDGVRLFGNEFLTVRKAKNTFKRNVWFYNSFGQSFRAEIFVGDKIVCSLESNELVWRSSK